jgi:hypothetical protein
MRRLIEREGAAKTRRSHGEHEAHDRHDRHDRQAEHQRSNGTNGNRMDNAHEASRRFFAVTQA